MRDELEKRIVERYPDLYTSSTIIGDTATFESVGFSHGDGWFDIIECLSSTINQIMKYHPARNHLTPEEFEKSHQVKAVQVKEKFGALRYYVNNANPEVQSAIMLAELMSSRVCEECGDRGKPRSGGWIRTLCDKCEEKTKGKKA